MKIQGVRIPVSDHDQIYPMNPGEYMGPKDEYERFDPPVPNYSKKPLHEIMYKGPKKSYVWFISPVEGMSLCKAKRGPWLFKEEDDGTLTITPSLDCKGAKEWHGFLTKGQWCKV